MNQLGFFSWLFATDAAARPKNESLEEHKKHCKAKPGNCPFERRVAKEEANAEREDVEQKPKGDGSSVTLAEDAAYADAVKSASSGARQDALHLLRTAAAKSYPENKLVDKSGLPLVLFRGERDSLPNARKGIQFLTNDYGTANNYKENHAEIHGEPTSVREYFAVMKNPLVLVKLKSLEEDRKDYYGKNNRYTAGAQAGPWDFKKLHEVLTAFRTSKFNTGDKKHVAFDPNDEKRTKEYGFAGQLDDYVRNKAFYEQDEDAFEKDWKQFAAFVKAEGYDGIIGQHYGSLEYITLSPEQMKSADITYDDAGNLIPLSKRFDGGPDIRGAVEKRKKPRSTRTNSLKTPTCAFASPARSASTSSASS